MRACVPMIEHAGQQAYLINRDGTRYRVYDVPFGPPLSAPHKRGVLPLESLAANHR